MPLIRRRRIPLPLEHMPQMSSTPRTHNLRPFHPKSAIHIPLHGAGDAVEIRRPAAPGLELLVGGVERGVAGGAVVGACGRHVFVVGAGEGGFGAFFAEDAELSWGEDGAPFGGGFLDGGRVGRSHSGGLLG